jgi:hypothetical protein
MHFNHVIAQKCYSTVTATACGKTLQHCTKTARYLPHV